jgi:hypothetical protein
MSTEADEIVYKVLTGRYLCRSREGPGRGMARNHGGGCWLCDESQLVHLVRNELKLSILRMV